MTQQRFTRRDAIKSFAAFAGAAAVMAACGSDNSGSSAATTAAAATGSTAAGGVTTAPAVTTTAAPQWTTEKANVSASLTSVNHLWAQWGVKQGIYKKHFLDVTVVDNIADPASALVAGQVDFMATGTGTVQAAVRGNPIRSQMLTFRDNYAIMVNPQLTSLEALKGKSIIGPNDVIKAAILAKGVDPNSITWVTSRGTNSQNIDLVKSGQADGVAGFPPLQFLGESAGLHLALITSDVFPGAPVSNTATSIDIMTKKPDYVRRMIAANLEILKHLRDNKPMVIDFFKAEWGQDDKMAELSYGVIQRDMFQDGKTDSATLQSLVDIVAKAQSKTTPTAWTDVFDFNHLAAVAANPGKY